MEENDDITDDRDDVTKLVDAALANLYAHPGAETRYAAAVQLKNTLTAVQAISAKQLETELGSLTAAAHTLGVTRQYIDKLYRENDTPGPRASGSKRSGLDVDNNRPSYLLGRLHACLEAIEVAATDDNAITLGKAYATAISNPAVTLNVYKMHGAAWLRRLESKKSTRAAAFRSQIGDLIGRIDTSTLGSLRGNPEEQSVFIVGYHHQRPTAGRP